MGVYTSSIFGAIPVSFLPVAQPIAKAVDPDTGGSHTFDAIRATKDGVTYAICHTPAKPATAAGVAYLVATPGALHASVARDFAARWPEDVPPTATECAEFCAALTLRTGLSLMDALADAGMELIDGNTV